MKSKTDEINDLFGGCECADDEFIYSFENKERVIELLNEGYYPEEIVDALLFAKDTPEVLELLLNSGEFDPNTIERHGHTLLTRYNRQISDEQFKVFVNAGAYLVYPLGFSGDWRYHSRWNNCPFIALVHEKRIALMEYFLKNHPEKVPLQYEHPDGILTGGPLHYAVERNKDGRFDEVISLLLKYGADKSAIGEDCWQKVEEVDGKLVLVDSGLEG